jgi:hypothetical protein
MVEKIATAPAMPRMPPTITRRALRVIMEESYMHSLTSQEKKNILSAVLAAIDAQIENLEQKLADNARALRSEVKEYVRQMTSKRLDRQDGFANVSVVFRKPSDPKQIIVRLESDEADEDSGKGKMEKMVAWCISVAKSDLSFLKRTSEAIKKNGAVPEDDRKRLKEILENNSYWRFIELT